MSDDLDECNTSYNLAGARARDGGYRLEDIQWLLSPDMHQGAEHERAERLITRFLAGNAQVRLTMVGENAGRGGGEVMYGLKVAPLRADREFQQLVMIRLDAATGQMQDVREVSCLALFAPPLNNLPSSENWSEPMRCFAEALFGKVALWHAEDFGPGPMAEDGLRAEWESSSLTQSTAPSINISRPPRM